MDDILESLAYRSSASGAIAVLTVILAIAATVLAFIFIIPEKKRAGLSPFLRFLHDVFNFRHLLIESILRVMYVLSTALVILSGFFMLFQFNQYTGWAGGSGLLLMILGPIAVRLVYEGLMLVVLLVKNVISINNKLSNGTDGDLFSRPDIGKVGEELRRRAERQPEPAQPVQPVQPVQPIMPVQPAQAQPAQAAQPVQPIESAQAQPAQPVNAQPVQPTPPEAVQPEAQKKRFCTRCGSRLDDSGACPNCGR